MEEIKKTRREHLKVLPLQKRLQAMENIRREAFPSFKKSLIYIPPNEQALLSSFTFAYTRQGFDYWWTINEKYFSNGQ